MTEKYQISKYCCLKVKDCDKEIDWLDSSLKNTEECHEKLVKEKTEKGDEVKEQIENLRKEKEILGDAFFDSLNYTGHFSPSKDMVI